jgi:2-dehydropantoate 2-reductase
MVFGGLMTEQGHRVCLVGRGAHMAAVRENGVRIEGIWGEHLCRVEEAVERVGDLQRTDFQLVLVCVKSYDTAAAVEACRLAVGAQTLVVHLQNGYGNVETGEAAFGPQRTIAARVLFGVDVVGDGRVKVTVCGGPVYVGSRTNAIPPQRLEAVASAFAAAGIPSEATDQIQQWLWLKIAYNAALNPLGALLGVRYGELAAHPHTRAVMDEVLAELLAATRAAGIPMFHDDLADLQRHFYEKMLPPTAAHYPSMLADLLAGRRTEIDALNGAVGELGRRLGVQTPVNRTLCDLIRAREQVGQRRNGPASRGGL